MIKISQKFSGKTLPISDIKSLGAPQRKIKIGLVYKSR